MSQSVSTCEAPVYQPLVDSIRGRVRRGALRPGQQIGSEIGLMRQTGLSRNSVRRAVQTLMGEGLVERRPGKGVFVRPPNVTTRTVEVVVPGLESQLVVGIAAGVRAVGRERGVRVRIHDCHGDMDHEVEQVRLLAHSGANGAVIVALPHERFAEAVYQLKSERFAFVVVDEPIWGLPTATVMSDNYGGGYAVGKALTHQGHRRIGFIGNLTGGIAAQRRLEGLIHAVNDAGIAFDRSLVADLNVPPLADWSEAIERETRRLMLLAERPTALFFVCDAAAAVAYRTLRSMNLHIGRDVSVVGYDDDPICELLDPPLATVRQPSQEIGRAAADCLMQMIDAVGSRSRAAGDNHQQLPVKFVHRDSLGPCV